MNKINEIKKIKERLEMLYDIQYRVEQDGRNSTYIEDKIFELEVQKGILEEEIFKNSKMKEKEVK